MGQVKHVMNNMNGGAVNPEERELGIGADEDLSSFAETGEALVGDKKELRKLLELYAVAVSYVKRYQVRVASGKNDSLCGQMRR